MHGTGVMTRGDGGVVEGCWVAGSLRGAATLRVEVWDTSWRGGAEEADDELLGSTEVRLTDAARGSSGELSLRGGASSAAVGTGGAVVIESGAGPAPNSSRSASSAALRRHVPTCIRPTRPGFSTSGGW